MNTIFVICLYLALTVAVFFVWRLTVAAMRRRAQKIGTTNIKDFVRLREDTWCRAYISIGMLLNCLLLALAFVIKQAVLI
jgi:DMSO/TMAO reductase YedYZ heme-binding membrane subunit